MNDDPCIYAIWRGEIVKLSNPSIDLSSTTVTRHIFRDPTPEDYATLIDVSDWFDLDSGSYTGDYSI